jgi:flagellar biosynthetic protein FliO
MSTVVLLVRVAVSLAVVLGLLVLAARFARRGPLAGAAGRSGARVEVVARQGLGRNASLVVVRALERALVLGVTESSVSLLADGDVSLLDLADAPGTVRSVDGLDARPSAWKAVVEQLRDRTARRS